MNMSQVVAFTQRIEFKTLLELECRTLTGFSPVIYDNMNDFNSMLAMFKTIDILIIDEPAGASVFHSLQTEINTRRDQIENVFFLSDQDLMLEDVKIYPKFRLEDLLIEMKNLVTPPEPNHEGYISIPINTLMHFKVLPFPLYVKINETRYLKRIPAHEEIEAKTFKSFIAKGIADLYFERKNNHDFSVMLINSMINKVEQDYINIDEKLLATNDVFITTQQIVGKLGFKPRVVEVCESVLNQITDDVSSGKDNFSKFLGQLRAQTDLSFHYRLMELTSFIATQMLEESEKSGTKEKLKKIIFASMFCDYTLLSPGQIHIRTQAQLIKLQLNEQKVISEHALRASELVNKYQNAPYESSLIIKQHHGSFTGVGFPKEISPDVLPLTKCLMTAQEVSYQILMHSTRHPIDVLSDIKLKFIDTPLEEHFILFENTCQKNIQEQG